MDPRALRIDGDADEPIYRQIASQVRRLVANGSLAVGSALPSVRAVAAVHRINPMTVSQAYQCLVREGIAHRERGRRLRVAKAAASAEARSAMLDAHLSHVLQAARELGLDADDVIERLRLLADRVGADRYRQDSTQAAQQHDLA